MFKRFIIIYEKEDNNQIIKLTEFFKSQNIGWAHHFKNSWIVLDYESKYETRTLRTAIQDFFIKNDYIVVEVFESHWSARGNTAGNFMGWLKSKFTLDTEKAKLKS